MRKAWEGQLIPLRSLPRVFVPGADPSGAIELPKEEVDKLRKVLRLTSGAHIGVLPNDGRLIRCVFDGHEALPIEVVTPNTEPALELTIAQALPKGDKLDEIVRACSELGASHFMLFPSERTVVKWDERKKADRVHRLETIAREAAEVSFRTILPTFRLEKDLRSVLDGSPSAIVLSEVEGVSATLVSAVGAQTRITLVVGPEGGWARGELEVIGSRGVSLGPRVLRVDHAAAAAAAILLLNR